MQAVQERLLESMWRRHEKVDAGFPADVRRRQASAESRTRVLGGRGVPNKQRSAEKRVELTARERRGRPDYRCRQRPPVQVQTARLADRYQRSTTNPRPPQNPGSFAVGRPRSKHKGRLLSPCWCGGYVYVGAALARRWTSL